MKQRNYLYLEANMTWQEDYINIHHFKKIQPYGEMWDRQKEWVLEIDQQLRHPSLLLLEHQHVYTFGRASHQEHLLISPEKCKEQGIELYEIDRGGDITYHGPGQLVGYPLLHLGKIGNDAHLYLRKLEESVIQALKAFDVEGDRKAPYTGVWVGDTKICAMGVKFNRGRHSKAFITSHGFALNVNTDLDMFNYIIPCGIREYGVTSLQQLLGHKVDIEKVKEAFIRSFCDVFELDIQQVIEDY